MDLGSSRDLAVNSLYEFERGVGLQFLDRLCGFVAFAISLWASDSRSCDL